MIIEIKLGETVGIYGRDIEGKPWATFQTYGNPPVPHLCDICGAGIYRGWVRGKWGEEDMHVCHKHVSYVETFGVQR